MFKCNVIPTVGEVVLNQMETNGISSLLKGVRNGIMTALEVTDSVPSEKLKEIASGLVIATVKKLLQD
ncbi:MAG: hypothetical protein V1851_00775 [Patescibacteria group bacterium]